MVREDMADSPRPSGGRSVKCNRTTSSAPRNSEGSYPTRGLSEGNLCCADGPRPLCRRSAKPLSARNSWPNESKRRRSRTCDEHEEPYANWLHADCPHLPGLLSARCGQARKQQPKSKPARTLPPILRWISQTAQALEERFGEDVKHP
jgi:hypothetical protein